MRLNYWSLSKFADWLRSKKGIIKPYAATMEDWKEWNSNYKIKHPKWYYLTEELLDKLQDIWMYIPDRLHDARYYIRNRYFDKLHYIPTKLKPGEFYESDTRILHGMFETLVDFIEIEKAWMEVVFSDKNHKKYKFPWWQKWKRFRCPEAGIAYLQWEMTLTEEVPHQAQSAKEQHDLYMWWKYVRPERKEILYTEEDCFDIENRYHEEDNKMLIRLINIRKSLWT